MLLHYFLLIFSNFLFEFACVPYEYISGADDQDYLKPTQNLYFNGSCLTAKKVNLCSSYSSDKRCIFCLLGEKDR